MKSVPSFYLALFTAIKVAFGGTTAGHAQQAILGEEPLTTLEEGVGHFSEWSRNTKKEFLIDWQADRESEWIFVLGNEGGDLDSLTSALAWVSKIGCKIRSTLSREKIAGRACADTKIQL